MSINLLSLEYNIEKVIKNFNGSNSYIFTILGVEPKQLINSNFFFRH
jgi:hypothetical protein